MEAKDNKTTGSEMTNIPNSYKTEHQNSTNKKNEKKQKKIFFESTITEKVASEIVDNYSPETFKNNKLDLGVTVPKP